MYDKKSRKTGVELFRSEYHIEQNYGVVCFFNITNTDNDFQSTDASMIQVGNIINHDPFIINRIECLIERDPKDIECVKYLKNFLYNCKRLR